MRKTIKELTMPKVETPAQRLSSNDKGDAGAGAARQQKRKDIKNRLQSISGRQYEPNRGKGTERKPSVPNAHRTGPGLEEQTMKTVKQLRETASHHEKVHVTHKHGILHAERGISYGVVLHPHHIKALRELPESEPGHALFHRRIVHHIRDEQGGNWIAHKEGNHVHLHGAGGNTSTNYHIAFKKEHLYHPMHEEAVIEGRESEFSANMHLSSSKKRAAGHYLMRGGEAMHKEPHPTAQHALTAYNALPNKEGVKIHHVKEEKETAGSYRTFVAKNNSKKEKARVEKNVRDEKKMHEETILEHITDNEGYGYHGEAHRAASEAGQDHEGANEHAHAAYFDAHQHVMKHTGASHLEARHYLDSVHGRHFHSHEGNLPYLKKDFAKFKKTYKPEHFAESRDDRVSAKHGVGVHSHKSFMHAAKVSRGEHQGKHGFWGDYYNPADGEKRYGFHHSPKSHHYSVQDSKTGKTHKFKYNYESMNEHFDSDRVHKMTHLRDIKTSSGNHIGSVYRKTMVGGEKRLVAYYHPHAGKGHRNAIRGVEVPSVFAGHTEIHRWHQMHLSSHPHFQHERPITEDGGVAMASGAAGDPGHVQNATDNYASQKKRVSMFRRKKPAVK